MCNEAHTVVLGLLRPHELVDGTCPYIVRSLGLHMFVWVSVPLFRVCCVNNSSLASQALEEETSLSA